MQNRYAVDKIVGGEVVNTHKFLNFSDAKEMADAINLVKGSAEIRNINRD